MKTNEVIVKFTKADVQEYVGLLGDTDLIYQSIEAAQNKGFTTIPLHPAMPMICYKTIEVPWQSGDSIVHRRQQSIHHRTLYIDHNYIAQVILNNRSQRRGQIFMKQTLYIRDMDNSLCFEGISDLIVGGRS